VPAGVTLRDIREFLPEEHKYKYKQAHPFGLTQDNNKEYSTLAMFSDAFRIMALRQFGGWYFDTDCFCLKDQSEFKKLKQDKNIVIAYEGKNNWYAGSAILYFKNYEIANLFCADFEKCCVEYNYEFPEWALAGPRLVSQTIINNNLSNEVLSSETFYPINWTEMELFIDKNLINTAKEKSKNSYVTHVWNSQLNQKYDLKGKVPPQGSHLEELFNTLDVKPSVENKVILNKQPKTFVIALKDNPISLSQLEDCLMSAKQHGWDIEVFWGTNGKTLSLDSWKEIGVNPLLHKGSMTKLGTWGCFFSHWDLWNKCVELNEPIIVLEHDAVIQFPWSPIEISDALIKLHEDYSFKIDSRGWIDPDGFVDSDSGQASSSTHAYCITPEQANKLIHFAKTVGGYATDRMIGDKVFPVIHMGNPTIVTRQNTYSTTNNL
jgi:hypothetical protein